MGLYDWGDYYIDSLAGDTDNHAEFAEYQAADHQVSTEATEQILTTAVVITVAVGGVAVAPELMSGGVVVGAAFLDSTAVLTYAPTVVPVVMQGVNGGPSLGVQAGAAVDFISQLYDFIFDFSDPPENSNNDKCR